MPDLFNKSKKLKNNDEVPNLFDDSNPSKKSKVNVQTEEDEDEEEVTFTFSSNNSEDNKVESPTVEKPTTDLSDLDAMFGISSNRDKVEQALNELDKSKPTKPKIKLNIDKTNQSNSSNKLKLNLKSKS